MIICITILAYISIAALIYIFLGYPLLLAIIAFLFSRGKTVKRDITPSVSLIISCYNEQGVIAEKLANSLQLTYPKDHLEIIVASDASTDLTEEIVKQYESEGVRLLRIEGRLGKTACLNHAVRKASGQIIVFSDANAMYKHDAIQNLVRNFQDPKVGYVVGEAKYADKVTTPAARSESIYWKYEIWVKYLESRCHSTVGGDGAIYAIRKELYEDLKFSDINDFVNPLQIVAKGYRGLYEPHAICWENTSGSFNKEFARKVRIVNRSFSGLLRVPSVLNPFKVGIFSFEIVSHKLLRWFSPFFFITLCMTSFILAAVQDKTSFQYLSAALVLFFILADIGFLMSKNSKSHPIFYMPYYFIVVNLASLIGIYQRLRGTTQITWTPHRAGDKQHEVTSPTLYLIQISIALMVIYLIYFSGVSTSEILFWLSFSIVSYVYFGYPAVLFAWSFFLKKPIKQCEISPSVSLLICAYNEQEVIEEKIRNSKIIDYPKEKLFIVIASDGSTDATNDIVRKQLDDQVTLYEYIERAGKIGAILKTVPKLETDIIVFSDANTMYAADAIRKLVRNFCDPTVGAVSADVILQNSNTTFGKSEGVYYQYERWIQRKESEVGSLIGADGGMYAIRSKLFVGPSADTILDDFVISMNVALGGKRLVYESEAKGYEKSTISYKSEFLRKSRVIAGAIQALKRGEGIPGPNNKGLFFSFISHKLLRWLVPCFLILLMISNLVKVADNIYSLYLFSLLGQILFYFAAFIGVFRSKNSDHWLTAIPFYFCLVNSAALYGIFKGLLNKQPVTWKKFERI